MSLPGSAHKESGLELFAVLLAGGILFGIAASIFILVAPHAPGGWRAAVAAAVVGTLLALIDLGLARHFRQKRVPSALSRFGIALMIGATLGLLWGVVAGHRPLWLPAMYGAIIALVNAAFGGFWRRRREIRSPSA